MWVPSAKIEQRVFNLKIDPVFYQKVLTKFRKGYYYDGESLNELFSKFFSKERESFKRRSQSQKARHHKRQSFAPPKRSEAVYYKNIEHGRKALAEIKELLSK